MKQTEKCQQTKPTAREHKKEFLSRYSVNEMVITRLEEEIAFWESRAEKVTASYSHAPKGEGEDRIQRAIEELYELRGQLLDALNQATTLRNEIFSTLETVKDSRLKLLLEYRYIDGLTWEKISQKIYCDYRWTLRLHDKALDSLVI